MSCGVGVTESQPSLGNFEKQGNTTFFAVSMYLMGQKQIVLCNLQVVNAYLIFDSHALQI